MGIAELFVVSVSLAMDAFAVSVCKGLNMKRINYAYCVVIALSFGIFQAMMPVIGYFMGSHFKASMLAYDHWVSFFLLLAVGANMIKEALAGEEDDEDLISGGGLHLRELLVLSVATSIDALAVGVTLAFLTVNLWRIAPMIGVITFCLSLLGVGVGSYLGARIRKWAEIAGGVMLILIGIHILAEHLGVWWR